MERSATRIPLRATRALWCAALLASLGLVPLAHAQTTALFEDFEDGAVEYTTSPASAEYNDGGEDFFTRTDGSDIASGYEVTGNNGSFYFAAQDLDGDGEAATQSLVFSGIDITGLTDLQFSALFAEDDASDGNEDWDSPDNLRVFASIDGGAEVQIFGIENDGTTFNSAPFVDNDLDGTGEGAEITSTFAEYFAAIAGTGSSLDLRIEISLNAGDEDIAIDDVTVTGMDGVAEPVGCTTEAPLTFDFDDDGDGSGTDVMADDFNSTGTDATFGEFVGVRNEADSGLDVNLSTCSFVVFDPFEEDITFSVVTGGTVSPGDAYVLATMNGDQAFGQMDVLTDSPGAFALVTGTATVGADFSTVLGRIVAAVVYDANRDFYASVGGGATDAEIQAFAEALAAIASGAVAGEDDGALDLTLAAAPNPISGMGTVSFGLAEASDVRVALYDALGREVAVLAEGPYGVGRHTVALAASSLPAGVYVVRVVTDANAQTTRVTVVR